MTRTPGGGSTRFTVIAAIASVSAITACSNGSSPQRDNATGAGAIGAAGATNNAGGTGAGGATTGTTGASGTSGASSVSAANSAGSSGSGGGSTALTAGGGSGGAAQGGGGAGSAAQAGVAGTSGAAGATSTAIGELQKGPFSCSTYIGAALTSEWWGQGFEDIVDDTKWQLKWHHHGFVEAWGDASSPFWGDTGDPNDPNGGSPIISPCTQSSTTPDRVVFLAMDWELLTEQAWIDWLEKDLIAIKTKYPSAKWIDLMPTVRCPNNDMCNPNAMPGPGANSGAGPEDCYIPPFEDSAIEKVVAAHPDYVGLGPIVMATTCNGGNGAHLTAADNQAAATAIGNYYLALP